MKSTSFISWVNVEKWPCVSLWPLVQIHHRTMINENPELSEVFPEPLLLSNRVSNLQKLLCKAKLPKVTRNKPRSAHRSSAGWKRCSSSGGNPCNQCPYTPISAASITSHINGYTHNITSSINCKTENVIYGYKCKKCSGEKITQNL